MDDKRTRNALTTIPEELTVGELNQAVRDLRELLYEKQLQIQLLGETMTAKAVSDYIVDRFMDSFYLTKDQKVIDPKWIRERANNIAAGLTGVLIK